MNYQPVPAHMLRAICLQHREPAQKFRRCLQDTQKPLTSLSYSYTSFKNVYLFERQSYREGDIGVEWEERGMEERGERETDRDRAAMSGVGSAKSQGPGVSNRSAVFPSSTHR